MAWNILCPKEIRAWLKFALQIVGRQFDGAHYKVSSELIGFLNCAGKFIFMIAVLCGLIWGT